MTSDTVSDAAKNYVTVTVLGERCVQVVNVISMKFSVVQSTRFVGGVLTLLPLCLETRVHFKPA